MIYKTLRIEGYSYQPSSANKNKLRLTTTIGIFYGDSTLQKKHKTIEYYFLINYNGKKLKFKIKIEI